MVSGAVHGAGIWVSRAMFEFFTSPSDYSRIAVEATNASSNLYIAIVFPVVATASFFYVAPLYRALYKPASEISTTMRARALALPGAFAALGALPWVARAAINYTVVRQSLGYWSDEVISSHIITPLASGFIVTTSAYLIIEWITRERIVPAVTTGTEAPPASRWVLSVPARLFVLMGAVAIIPGFTITGIIRNSEYNTRAGMPDGEALGILSDAIFSALGLLAPFGVLFTALLAASLARPLRSMAKAIESVRRGDLDVAIPVRSGDEVGVLARGVNDLAASLRERSHILGTFGRLVEPAVRDRLLAGNIQSGGEHRNVTVTFVDLAGFTGIAETQDPARVTETLNSFFKAVTDAAKVHGGYVDKYIGDAVMLVFGLFDDQSSPSHHALAAHDCVLEMQRNLVTLNANRSRADEAPIAMRIGIHTGAVIAGTFGTDERHDFTVVGDAVNVAARLQESCKDVGVDLLMSEVTARAVEVSAAGRDAIGTKTWQGDLALRGRSGAVAAVGRRLTA